MVQKLKKGLSTYKIEIVVFALYLLILIYLRIYFPFNYELNFNGKEMDWEFYYMMASNPVIIFNKQIPAPFCYRLFTPLLVNALPFNIAFNFHLISFISFYISGILLYFTLRIHFNKVYSVIGLMILCFLMATNALKILSIAFVIGYTAEGTMFLFLICCFYAILKQNKILYGIFLFFGAMTKENILFTIPVFLLYTYYSEFDKIEFKKGINTIYRNIKYVLPAIAIVLFLRLIVIPPSVQLYPEYYELGCQGHEYMSLGFLSAIIQIRLENLYEFFNRITMLAWSFPIMFCFSNKKKHLFNWIKIYGIFMILSFLQVFIAWQETRLIQIAYYPVIFLEVLGFKNVVDFIIYDEQKLVEVQFFPPLKTEIMSIKEE